MSRDKPGHLKILEHANDLALVDYWKSVMLLEECEDALEATNEALAVRLALHAKRDAQNKGELMDLLGLVPQMAPFDGRDKALRPAEEKAIVDILLRLLRGAGETPAERIEEWPLCDYTRRPSLDKTQLCRCDSCQNFADVIRKLAPLPLPPGAGSTKEGK